MTAVVPIRAASTVIPSAIEAEQALIGAALMVNASYDVASGIIAPDDFFDPFHAHVWRAIGTCIGEGRISSPLTIAAMCGHVNDIAGMTVREYLTRCVTEAMPVEWTANYARLVKDASVRRRMIVMAERLDADARNTAGTEPANVLATALSELDEVRSALQAANANDRAHIATFAGQYVEKVQDRLSGRGGATSLHCGLTLLDRQLGGFQRSGVTVVAGRPGMGKSALAVDLAYRLAEQGHAGAFFSIEMGADQMLPRFFSSILTRTGPRVEYSAIMRGDVSSDCLDRMIEAERRMKTLPLFLDTVSSPTVSEIQSRCRSATAQLGGPLDFIVVDYLGLVSASARYQGQRTQEVGEVSRGMKALAKTMGCAVILLAQLNRKNEDRGDKRPELSDLRDSGEIEQDAEAVLFPFREAYYLQSKTDHDSLLRYHEVERVLEIIVAKNRHGSTGSMRLYCDIGANLIDNMQG